MNSLRRVLVGRRQIRKLVWLASLAAMAVGLLFALEGVWFAAVPFVVVAGAAMWLVGAWVLPWTRDAYVRRVQRTWRTWTADTEWADAELTRNREQFLQRLGTLDPPDELRVEHEHLVTLVAEHNRLARQWPRTPALLSEAAAIRRAAREDKERLVAQATLEAHRSYAVELARLNTPVQQHPHGPSRYEDAAERALWRLEQMTRPPSAHAEHALLIAGVQEHLDLARRLQEASRAADPQGVQAAAADLEASVITLRERLARLGEQLEHERRWPVASGGSSTTDPKRD
jgi:xanthosine utilization system XapX-like protein